MEIWEQFGRVGVIGFQVFGAMILGVLLGVGVDTLVPQLGSIGAIAGGVLGSALALYLMVRGMRSFFAESDATSAERQGEDQP